MGEVTLLDVVTTVVAGGVFGLAIAAPPGPMNAIIAEESVVRGWSAGFRAGLGAMAADACFLVLAVVGAVAVVERVPAVRGAAFAVGGLLMLYFAVGAARSALDPPETDASVERGRGFRKAFVLAITNPFQIAFWLTVGVGLLEPGRVDVLGALPTDALAGVFVVSTGTPVLVVGFFAGILGWITCFPAALVAADRRAARVGPTVAAASAVVLAGFGVVFLGEALALLGLFR